jgi:hypothetical protein
MKLRSRHEDSDQKLDIGDARRGIASFCLRSNNGAEHPAHDNSDDIARQRAHNNPDDISRQ